MEISNNENKILFLISHPANKIYVHKPLQIYYFAGHGMYAICFEQTPLPVGAFLSLRNAFTGPS